MPVIAIREKRSRIGRGVTLFLAIGPNGICRCAVPGARIVA